MQIHDAIGEAKTALITGGANGIGLAVADKLAAAGMQLVLLDRDEAALAAAQDRLGAVTHAVDVSDENAWQTVASSLKGLPPLTVLFNNAGASIPVGHCWENTDQWRKQIDINFGGIMLGVQTCVPLMQAHGQAGLVINTGSKQGITKPPGNYAYNVSKAAVLAFTECLAHDLRNEEGNRISAHLLVPGFTYSAMISQFIKDKPDGAWSCEQVADFLLEGIANDDFYILCPDNDVSREMDNKRMQWAVGDLIENRPPLSRWHPDYAKAFEAFMQLG